MTCHSIVTPVANNLLFRLQFKNNIGIYVYKFHIHSFYILGYQAVKSNTDFGDGGHKVRSTLSYTYHILLINE